MTHVNRLSARNIALRSIKNEARVHLGTRLCHQAVFIQRRRDRNLSDQYDLGGNTSGIRQL
jgi:hypothetical protein